MYLISILSASILHAFTHLRRESNPERQTFHHDGSQTLSKQYVNLLGNIPTSMEKLHSIEACEQLFFSADCEVIIHILPLVCAGLEQDLSENACRRLGHVPPISTLCFVGENREKAEVGGSILSENLLERKLGKRNDDWEQ